MDYDSARQAPPSYALEDGSDNESDFGGEETGVTYNPDKQLKQDPVVFIRGQNESNEDLETGTEVVLLVGEAGERFSRGILSSEEGEVIPHFQVLVNEEQVSWLRS